MKRKLRHSFDEVNRGNLGAIVRQFSPDAEHWFSGSHGLSGRRDNIADISQWYDRLAVVLPDLKFEITAVTVSGWPWNTVAMVEWVDSFTDRQGYRYSNQGVHIIGLKWGKLTSLHIYCDTQKLSDACRALGEQGVKLATAPPIGAQEPFAAAQRVSLPQ
ncbi:MAG TPA: nuclear transport factor 2 family protein [Propionibacteriaceae bacterium]|nr:nuclear transport factor 2 family protein [Propionibacteriaceae bacterium]